MIYHYLTFLKKSLPDGILCDIKNMSTVVSLNKIFQFFENVTFLMSSQKGGRLF